MKRKEEMTDERVFTQIVERAINNGWSMFTFRDWPNHVGFVPELDGLGIKVACNPRPFLFSMKDVLFDHGFEKYFFGKEWKGHIKKVVLETNPIKYFYNYL